MRSIGFKEVYNMNGGIIKWRADGLPEIIDTEINSAGMTRQQFDDLLETDQLVLIDFYAHWCAPCKKMEPYLDELKTEKKGVVTIVRIDIDQNRTLAEELHIEVLPTLLLYKNKKLIWSGTGYISKENLVKHFNQ
jgi:thioredoxin